MTPLDILYKGNIMYAVSTKRRNRKKSNFCPCYYSRLRTHKLINPFFHLFSSKVSRDVRRNIIKTYSYHVRKINGELNFSKKQDMRRFDLFQRCYSFNVIFVVKYFLVRIITIDICH